MNLGEWEELSVCSQLSAENDIQLSCGKCQKNDNFFTCINFRQTQKVFSGRKTKKKNVIKMQNGKLFLY
jgi:hypothetical protein